MPPRVLVSGPKHCGGNYELVSNVCNALCVLFRKNSLIFLSDAC